MKEVSAAWGWRVEVLLGGGISTYLVWLTCVVDQREFCIEKGTGRGEAGDYGGQRSGKSVWAPVLGVVSFHSSLVGSADSLGTSIQGILSQKAKPRDKYSVRV